MNGCQIEDLVYRQGGLKRMVIVANIALSYTAGQLNINDKASGYRINRVCLII